MTSVSRLARREINTGTQDPAIPAWFEDAARRILSLGGLEIVRAGLVHFPGPGGVAMGIVTSDASKVDKIRELAFKIGREMNFGPIMVYGPGKQYRWPAFIPGSVREY